MPDGGEPVKIKVLNDIREVEAEAWDACAGPDNPFVSHGFLRVLEQSGSVSGRTGWLPQHLAIEDDDGRLIGAVPCYLKSHSYGEYVFDWGWADAFERAGGEYYPKLQISVPFTPVSGPRLMVRPGAAVEQTRLMLAAGLMELAKSHGVSSFHVTFCSEDEWTALGEAGLLQRMGQQFHWHNRGYESFDDFLAGLSSRKRKAIRKERREANADGMEIMALTGDALEERHMEAFYEFYLNTVDKKWSNAYLTRAFFRLLGTELSDKVVLIAAFRDGRLAGGALNLLGSDTLYGRNWGAERRYRMLYFEACFYRAIDYAIAHGLACVEAGAQGPHKIQRGYLPSPTYSVHWIREPRFREAVANFVTRERMLLRHEMDELAETGPYRRTDNDPA